MGERSDLLLPEGGLLLHIGPYKTGTTAIQQALHDSRPFLLEHGILYPGTSRRQRREGWAVLGRHPLGRRKPEMHEWEALVDEVRSFTGDRVVISTEDFGSAGPQQARRIHGDLGREPTCVVATTRRLDRLLPSQWQERIKSHDVHTFEHWLERVLGDDEEDREWRRFWASHDVTSTYERWSEIVGHDNFVLIAGDESNRRLLHSTFEEMLGLELGSLPDSSENTSLSANSIELLRLVNVTFAEGDWPDEAYFRVIQRGVLPHLVGVRHELDQKIPGLPEWAADRVAQLSEQRERFFRERGVRVVGDLATLRPDEAGRATPSGSPQTIPVEVAARALEGAVAGAMDLQRLSVREATSRAKRRRGVADPAPRPAVDDTPAADLLKVVARRAGRRLLRRR